MHGRAEECFYPPQRSLQGPTPKPTEGFLREEVPQSPLSLT